MVKFVVNILYVIVFFILLEIINYYIDYNELLILNNYIKYDIKSGVTPSFNNDKYNIYFQQNKEGISYTIIFKRESFFKIFKDDFIEYHNVID